MLQRSKNIYVSSKKILDKVTEAIKHEILMVLNTVKRLVEGI